MEAPITYNDKHKTILPNEHLCFQISSVIASASTTVKNDLPRTELDSHANMVVLGKNCFIFEKTGRTCDVSGFSPTLDSVTLPIVDAVIVYDCPVTLKSYLLMVRNALYVKEMEINLIPPFLMREANIHVNECPKQHATTPVTVDHHSIFFPEENMRIPLQLNGIFSYFNHRSPQISEIDNLTVLFLTPDSASWDPNSSDFSSQELRHLDHTTGEIIDPPLKPSHFLLTNEDTVDNHTACSVVNPTCAPLPTATDYDAAVDACISNATTQHHNYVEHTPSTSQNDCKEFYDRLNASIGSVLADDNDLSAPLFTTLDDLEDKFAANLSSM